MKKRLYCNFPQALIKEPILMQTLPKMFLVQSNLRGGYITDEVAVVYVDVEGEEGAVQKAIEYLKARGVTLREVDPNKPIAHVNPNDLPEPGNS